MKMSKVAALMLVFAVSNQDVYAVFDCPSQKWGNCGNGRSGASCCPDGQYCHPWNINYYQCRANPPQCGQQFVDTDFYGDDLFTFSTYQADECCAKCAETPGCVAYTFVANQPGVPSCYLKKGLGMRQKKKYALSGIVTSPGPAPPTTSPPPGVCPTPEFGTCRTVTESSCCPESDFCQPWNPGYYQCLPKPSKCSQTWTDVDFYGDDIKHSEYYVTAEWCCAWCAETPGCKAFTFVTNNPETPICYLKTGQGTRVSKLGAVSGLLK